ncbi:MAG: hypothetical protein ABI831_14345 [Betaproteobacteria bacterium]
MACITTNDWQSSGQPDKVSMCIGIVFPAHRQTEIAMTSAPLNTLHLLAGTGLVFSKANGFSSPGSHDEEWESPADEAGSGDRSYWIAYDYFMHELEQQAMRRARFYASAREFGTRLIQRLTGAQARPTLTDRMPA